MPKPRACPLCQQPADNKRLGKGREERFGCCNGQCELCVLALPQKQWDAMRFLMWVPAEAGTMPLDNQGVLFVVKSDYHVQIGYRETTDNDGPPIWFDDQVRSYEDEHVVEWMPCPEPSSRS